MRKLVERYRRYYNMEEWRDIEDYKGKYQVSNIGRVKSLERTIWTGKGYYKTLPERILKLRKRKDGYLQIKLYKDGAEKVYLVHRLVSEAFIPNPNNLPEINHKDENKQNNCVDNLEWCSRSYNNRYNGRAKKAGKKLAEKLSKPVYSISKESGLITYWKSATVASRQIGISQSNICNCLKGKRKSTGGFYWIYSESEEVANE